MSPTVKVYQPGIRVTLYKTVRRSTLDGTNPVSQRFAGQDEVIDLTPFLGEGSGVRTSKSVREPAGGFSITFADKPVKGGSSYESLFGLIEPMDMIEIRMRHDPPDLIGNLIAPGGLDQDPTRPVIVMRGFVSEVVRDEVMSADGKPSRAIVVNGQDYGKLWQQLQIRLMPGYVIGEDLLSGFRLFERFGVGFKTVLRAGEFIAETLDKIINPYLAGFIPEDALLPRQMALDSHVTHGVTSIGGIQSQQGTVYELMRMFTDVGVWNELFIEDREDGVHCVFRPNPAKDLDGELIYNKIHDEQWEIPEPIILPAKDIVQCRLSRSDANVANYYWVRAPRFEMVSDIDARLFAIQGNDRNSVLLDTYPNSATNLYGLRIMDTQTEMGGDAVTTFTSGQDKAVQQTRNNDMADWIGLRRRTLVEQNKDNVLLEQGIMRVRGNENIRAGSYIMTDRGGMMAEYYVVQVDHEYIPFQGFFSTLTVDRGMGFVERVRRDGGASSPYLAELYGGMGG